MIQEILSLVNKLAPNGVKQEAFVSICHNMQFQGDSERQIAKRLLRELADQVACGWQLAIYHDGRNLG